MGLAVLKQSSRCPNPSRRARCRSSLHAFGRGCAAELARRGPRRLRPRVTRYLPMRDLHGNPSKPLRRGTSWSAGHITCCVCTFRRVARRPSWDAWVSASFALGVRLFYGQYLVRSRYLVKPLRGQYLPRLGIEPDWNRRTIHPVKLDQVGCLSPHGQETRVKRGVVATALCRVRDDAGLRWSIASQAVK